MPPILDFEGMPLGLQVIGTLIWKYDTASAYPYWGVAFSPAVFNNIVFVGVKMGTS